MSDKIYDVFISYRRDGGFETAKHLNDLLCADGYSVSFDINTLREGDFDTALLIRIEQCVDFILIVDKHCFDKTLDNSVKREQDWLRIELAYALQLKKNIIPILLPRATFPNNLPDDIKDVPRKNGPTYSKEYYDNFYGKLKEMLHALPMYGIVNSKTSNRNSGPNLKVLSNLDCVMYLDEEEVGKITADKLLKIPLSEGEYMLRFESAENSADYIAKEFNMPDKDKLYKVDLLTLKQEREKKEREEKERQEQELLERERREKEEKEREALSEIDVKGVKFKMVKVEGGKFSMGATKEQGSNVFDHEKPAHEVALSDYYIGETLVTQELWKAVMVNNPSNWKGDNLPVERVSWEEAQEFIQKLIQKTGRTFRLPTEAEWEYAARGGKNSKGYKYSGSNSIDEVAWYDGNSSGKTHPVKEKKANELGLYDMSGNVWEWCNDCYGEYSSDAQTNPQGTEKGSGRVLRGGSWFNLAGSCRVSYRNYYVPTLRNYGVGFRLVVCP